MTLAYLASPYTKFDDGLDAAFIEACRLSAKFLKAGIFVYSPIVHLHPIAREGRIDPLDVRLFYPHNEVMMARCDTLIVAQLPGWEESVGVAGEILYFGSVGKPIFDLEPVGFILKRREECGADDRQLSLLSAAEA